MNKIKNLTSQQQKTLDFIRAYQTEYNTRPTLVEIGNHIVTTAAAAQFKVDSLFRKRIISLSNNKDLINQPKGFKGIGQRLAL